VLLGVAAIIVGIAGTSTGVVFMAEYRLLEVFGKLKFGVIGEWFKFSRAGPPYVE
jgi:hypothetical protein